MVCLAWGRARKSAEKTFERVSTRRSNAWVSTRWDMMGHDAQRLINTQSAAFDNPIKKDDLIFPPTRPHGHLGREFHLIFCRARRKFPKKSTGVLCSSFKLVIGIGCILRYNALSLVKKKKKKNEKANQIMISHTKNL